MAACATSPDHPPAVAAIRLFCSIDGDPLVRESLCRPCMNVALDEHRADVADGKMASLVVLSLAALPERVAE